MATSQASVMATRNGLKRAEQYCAPGRIVSCEDYGFAWSCDLPGFNLGADMQEYTVLYDD